MHKWKKKKKYLFPRDFGWCDVRLGKLTRDNVDISIDCACDRSLDAWLMTILRSMLLRDKDTYWSWSIACGFGNAGTGACAGVSHSTGTGGGIQWYVTWILGHLTRKHRFSRSALSYLSGSCSLGIRPND